MAKRYRRSQERILRQGAARAFGIPLRVVPYNPIQSVQAPPKPATRSVGYQRLIDALARLASGWAFVYDIAKGWRLRLGARTVKVRRDVVLAVAKLVIAAKGRKPVAA